MSNSGSKLDKEFLARDGDISDGCLLFFVHLKQLMSPSGGMLSLNLSFHPE